MEESLRWTVVRRILGGVFFVDSIRVKSDIRDGVIEEESFEVLLAILAEEEGIDPRTKALEGEVGGCEKSATLMEGGVVEGGKEAGLGQSQLKGAELSW